VRRTVYSQPIARPPEAIWSFLADLRNDVSWRSEITAVELVSGTPREAPATYRESVESEGLRAEVTLTVSESVRGSRLVILGAGPGYRSRSAWRFEPHDGGTLVTLAFSLETSGAVHLAEPLMWGLVTRWLERDLPRLEGHLSVAEDAAP